MAHSSTRFFLLLPTAMEESMGSCSTIALQCKVPYLSELGVVMECSAVKLAQARQDEV